VDDLEDLQDELVDLADENERYADRVAAALHQIALRYIYASKQSDEFASEDEDEYSDWESEDSGEAYNRAAEVIAVAQSLDGLSRSSKYRLANYQHEIAIGKVAALGEQGYQGNTKFVSSWQKLMGKLDQNRKRSCLGRRSNIESCSSAQSAMMSAAKPPQQAYQVDQQRIALQMQMQQTLFSAMNPSIAQGSAGAGAQGFGNQQLQTGAPGSRSGSMPLNNPLALPPGSALNTSTAGLLGAGGPVGISSFGNRYGTLL
jgi:hypothetical protein